MTAKTSQSWNFSPGEMRELGSRFDAREIGLIASQDSDATRIENFDRAVAALLHDTSAPNSLRRRVLDQLENAQTHRRRQARRRQWAVAITTVAASLLLFAWLRPFGNVPFDGEAVADQASKVYSLLTQEPQKLAPGRGDALWPNAIQPQTCVGHRDVGFFGQRVRAYQLASGNAKAVLIVVPAARFPFELDGQRIVVPQSARQLEFHCFESGNQVCILVLPTGVEPRRFETIRGIT